MEKTNGKRADKRITKTCLWCKSDFIIPRCRDWREHCCSSGCKKLLRDKNKQESIERRTRKCAECGSKFVARQNQIDAKQGIYCSTKCSTINMIRAAHTPEANKNRVEAVMKSDFQKNRPKGFDHPLTKERTKRAGYWWVQTDEGKKAEHRVVMENHIGRKLTKDEVVHHKDEDRLNNDITNLQIMTRAEHLLEHQAIRAKKG